MGEKARVAVYLDFSKTSDIVSHSILLQKEAAHYLGKVLSLLAKNNSLDPESSGEWS